MSGTSVSVAFEDIDPLVEYTPYSEGDPSQAWEIAYSEGSVQSPRWSWKQGRGVGVHRTRAPGAAFSFKFYGTSVMLYGDPQQSVFTISLDGRTPERRTGAFADGEIAGYENLALGEHTIMLVVESPQPELAFDRAVFSIEFESSVQNKTIPFDTDWSLVERSNWTTNAPGDGALQPSLRSGFTKAHGATASLNFRGSAIYIFGDVNNDHGQYSVSLDGEVSQWNGTTTYLGQAAVLYFQAGLDPSENHTVALTNLDRATFSFQGAVVIAPTGSEDVVQEPTTTGTNPSKPLRNGPSTAVIVGSAVAAISVAAMFIVIGSLFMRRRRELRKGGRSSIAPIFLNMSQRPEHPRTFSDQQLSVYFPAEQTLSEVEASMPRGPATTTSTQTDWLDRAADAIQPIYFQPDSSTMYSPSAATPSAAVGPTWAGTRQATGERKGQLARTGVQRESNTPGLDFQPPPYSRG